MIKKLSRLTSLTETEINIFIFVVAMLCIGIGIKYFTSSQELKSKKFSYAKEDSLFAYFNGLELDTAAAESESLFPNEKPFIAKNTEQLPYAKKTFSGTLNLNKASLDQLTTLPGIGNKTAEQILAYRNRVGTIKSLDELLNVKGIGEKKISKLKSFLTLK
ncbi:MAG: helix-hairpin-helix domain-containing protein [Ignavibacteriaceae bacterium]|jgi:competence protein ComEA|nr:helix-hairpin-helix domain-containing protein [Ignavibacteriaceae bacterium]